MADNISSNSPILETRDLVKRFGGLSAVDHLNFTLANNGRLHAIIGPNGAGKTTFFNLISGRLKPTSGRILFKGQDITGKAPHRIAQLGIARTLQVKSVFDAMSVEDNIWIAAQAKMAGWHPFRSAKHFPETRQKVEQVIEEVGLQEIAKREAGTLSYGDVALLEMGIALAGDPELLLLDEPICGMSPKETQRTVEKIVELSKIVNVILIEHDMEVVFDVADDITVMAQGNILAQGSPNEIAANAAVREAYLGYDDDTAASGPATAAQAATVAAQPKAAPAKTDKSTASTLFKIENLHAHYGKIHVLQGVNLEIGAGEAVALLGRNGVGKTTTLRAALNLMPRSEGRIYFEGQDITGLKAERLAALGIGYVPQGRGIFPLLSVMDNLTLGLPGRADPNLLEDVFERFPRLKERVSQKGGTLSGGEQQQLTIGRSLMMSPRLLILDEPTEGIMPILVADIRRNIESINRSGVSVLLVEQNVNTALKICQRTYIMEKGAVAFSGASDELRKQPEIIHRYLGLSMEPA